LENYKEKCEKESYKQEKQKLTDKFLRFWMVKDKIIIIA